MQLIKLSKAGLLFTVLLLPLLAGCEETSLPEGWRFPTNADFIGEWKENEKYVEKPYLAEADFDGNGVLDQAWILIKDDNSWGVFVILDLDSTDPDWIQLDITEKGSKTYLPPQSMGLDVVSEGKYKTVCGKGYDCEKNEPKEIELRLPAIRYFRYESASSIFYWDKKTSAFKRIWMSD
ncbi:hypothetical protein [Ghiorsea bivora]|uniref:hypothetical protein n=1 Tax=Ghiorsea bivora TaxID=1485545 RepID=UPI000570E502|nr:hypothetical protein [Ghiorsea bivora]